MKRILIIEDEPSMAEALKYTLEKEGYQVDVAGDGAEGLDRFQRAGADLILLDLMLPVVDGLEVCKRVRSASTVPILILTARDSDIDEVLGLELGADDYVTKPFNTRKLIARIKAVLRRGDSREEEERGLLEWGGITMDLEKHQVLLGGEIIHLTPLEYRILEALMRRPGKALPREFLLNAVWSGEFYGSPKTLDVHIRHLREKLEDDPASPRYIETVRGVGYRLEKPPEEQAT
ncbi:MAG: response regulator transcription factor [Actinomycetia bacterium]|nr:response regulator transcription factor [Verrucomicrobiota bacterium]MCG2796710.1 response regulator transcription factor [Actinomycetes bacterium]